MITLLFFLAALALFAAVLLLGAAVRRAAYKIRPPALCLLAFACFASFCSTPAHAAEGKSILSEISVSAVGAYQQAEFTHGPGQWGAGVDLSLPVNPFVSLRLRNLAYEGDGTWGDSVIDETALYGRADFKPTKSDKFFLFGVGGGSRHWDRDDWSLGLGLGAEYRFTKNVSVNIERDIRAYFKGSRDWLTTAAINIKF